MASMRAAAKGLAERLALLARPRSVLHGRVLVLAYHNIVPHGEQPSGDLSLHLSQANFGRHLDLIGERLRVVTLREALEPASDPTAPPRAVITWDDAYRGAVTAGVEEVARRGLPATMFAAPAHLDGGFFWWDALGEEGGLSPERRSICLDECRGRQEVIRERAAREGWAWRSPPEHARCASASELARAAATPGITLGSHSWSHPDLARSTPDELTRELEQSLEWLIGVSPGSAPTISYPYGRSSPAVESRAAGLGYAGGFLIEGGAFEPGGNRMAVPRLNVPAGLSLRGLELRLLGRLLG
jgi:peptidoglycan/xylan/chitin deacetylase (PgdA/CDA1 family)